MPSFSLPDLLRKSPKDSKKQRINESPAVEKDGRTAAPDRDSHPVKDVKTQSEADVAEAQMRKGRRGSRRDLLQDLRSRFGKAPSTPQRGMSAPPAPRDAAVVSGFPLSFLHALFLLRSCSYSLPAFSLVASSQTNHYLQSLGVPFPSRQHNRSFKVVLSDFHSSLIHVSSPATKGTVSHASGAAPPMPCKSKLKHR